MCVEECPAKQNIDSRSRKPPPIHYFPLHPPVHPIQNHIITSVHQAINDPSICTEIHLTHILSLEILSCAPTPCICFFPPISIHHHNKLVMLNSETILLSFLCSSLLVSFLLAALSAVLKVHRLQQKPRSIELMDEGFHGRECAKVGTYGCVSTNKEVVNTKQQRVRRRLRGGCRLVCPDHEVRAGPPLLLLFVACLRWNMISHVAGCRA